VELADNRTQGECIRAGHGIVVRGGPAKPTAAGEVRHFTVVREPNGKTSLRTYGYPNLKLRVTQKAPPPATTPP
jgi:hypothetical protein